MLVLLKQFSGQTWATAIRSSHISSKTPTNRGEKMAAKGNMF